MCDNQTGVVLALCSLWFGDVLWTAVAADFDSLFCHIPLVLADYLICTVRPCAQLLDYHVLKYAEYNVRHRGDDQEVYQDKPLTVIT